MVSRENSVGCELKGRTTISALRFLSIVITGRPVVTSERCINTVNAIIC